MIAKEQKWCAGERQLLKKLVPLETPISLLIEPSSYCNYKCYYCLRNLPREHVVPSKNMDLETFKKIVDDVKRFRGRVTAINLAGNGEPLMNQDLPKMIEYAKKSDICQTIKVITNGSLLNEEMGKKIVDAGLDVLRISLQGLNAGKVKEVCRYDLDYDRFMENIYKFYEYRKNCRLYIRILDEHVESKEQFYKMFENCCDELFIEHVCDFTNEQIDKEENIVNMMQETVPPVKVCSYPFYQFAIGADGSLYPCSIKLGERDSQIGNVRDIDLDEFWNGKSYSRFRYQYLNGELPICNACKVSRLTLQQEDNIDECQEKLLKYYRERMTD